MEFKEKLKTKRKELKMTQQDVAYGVGVSRSVVAKWETGLVVPKDDMMISLANFLKVDVADLYTDTVLKKNKINIAPIITLCIGLVYLIFDLFWNASRRTKEDEE